MTVGAQPSSWPRGWEPAFPPLQDVPPPPRGLDTGGGGGDIYTGRKQGTTKKIEVKKYAVPPGGVNNGGV